MHNIIENLLINYKKILFKEKSLFKSLFLFYLKSNNYNHKKLFKKIKKNQINRNWMFNYMLEIIIDSNIKSTKL